MIRRIEKLTAMLLVGVCLSSCAFAEFMIDRSVIDKAYLKIWNDDVQAQIDARIEKFRKADGAFEVSAPDGTEVKIEQISHAFQFEMKGDGPRRTRVLQGFLRFQPFE